jgi:hypothetical protein
MTSSQINYQQQLARIQCAKTLGYRNVAMPFQGVNIITEMPYTFHAGPGAYGRIPRNPYTGVPLADSRLFEGFNAPRGLRQPTGGLQHMWKGVPIVRPTQRSGHLAVPFSGVNYSIMQGD